MHANYAVVKAVFKFNHLAYRDFLIGFKGGLVCVVSVGAIVQSVFHRSLHVVSPESIKTAKNKP